MVTVMKRRLAEPQGPWEGNVREPVATQDRPGRAEAFTPRSQGLLEGHCRPPVRRNDAKAE
jgi:hypothetical protein